MVVQDSCIIKQTVIDNGIKSHSTVQKKLPELLCIEPFTELHTCDELYLVNALIESYLFEAPLKTVGHCSNCA